MSYCLKDEQALRVVRQLAKARGRSIVEVITRACQDALAAERSRRSLAQRLRPITEELQERRLEDRP